MTISRVEQFWAETDAAREATTIKARGKMQRLLSADLATLQSVLVQYRYFTLAYISDVALLISKMPCGRMRTFLADVLAEELGEKDHECSHPELYDRFLISVGVSPSELARMSAHPENMAMLNALSAEVATGTVGYGIGLRGMGGECLCQTYLTQLHEHFVENPRIRAMRSQIDWRFWDIHVGPIDLAHVEQTREAIGQLLLAQPELIDEVSEGYRRSIGAWDLFWTNLFSFTESVVPPEMAAAERPRLALR